MRTRRLLRRFWGEERERRYGETGRGRIALPVAGDPFEAREKVLRLVDELGFDPVDAGGLEESWRQQPGTPCYTKDLSAVQLKAALASAVRSLVPEYRKAADDAAKAFFQSEPER